MAKHVFTDGSFGIGHTTGAKFVPCVCGATKQTKHVARSSGRYGSHQGYRVEVTVVHKPLTK